MPRVLNVLCHWFLNAVRFVLGRADYLTLYPPLFPVAWVLRKKDRSLHRFYLRPESTDVFSLIEIFQKDNYSVAPLARRDELRRVFGGILERGHTPLIIDCGANNGISVAYLAMEWPEAKIVAVEPERGNVEMVRRNTKGRNVEIIQAGITARPTRLAIANENADANAFRTVEIDEGGFPGLTIENIVNLQSPGTEELFLVKIDIEGAEKGLFAKNTDWIDRTPLLAIELHDYMIPGEATSSNFLSAVAGRKRDFVCVDDIIFSIRNDTVASSVSCRGKEYAAAS